MSKPYYDHDETWRARRQRGYASWGSHADYNYREALERLLPVAPPPSRLLDIGCGAGRFGIFAEEAGYTYCGVDASREAIALGEEHYGHLDLQVVDAAADSAWVHPAGNFAIVTSLNALHCLTVPSDRQAFWNFCWRQVAAGGLFYLSTMGGPLATGARPSATPRAHLTQAELLAEFHPLGGEVIWEHWIPTSDYNPIPNWYLFAKKPLGAG